MKEYKREDWIDSTNETPLEFSIDVAESECFDEYAEKAKEELNCLRENIITDRLSPAGAGCGKRKTYPYYSE